MFMDNPCFNKLTRIDCPNRTEDCATKCEKWKKYVKERNEEYDKKFELTRLRNSAFIKHKPPRKRY